MKHFFQTVLIIILLGLSINVKSSHTSCDPLLKTLETTLKDGTHGPVWKAFLDEAGELGGKKFEMLAKVDDIVLRSNSIRLQTIKSSLVRGIKNIDEIKAAVPNFAELTDDAIIHILRGSDNVDGGLHHISGLLTQNSKNNFKNFINSTYDPNLPYKTLIDFNGTQKWKSFFPDSWDEIKVVRGIKNAFNNKIPDGSELNVFKGTTSEGIWIQIILNADGTIKTANPKI